LVRQKLAQQIIHGLGLNARARDIDAPFTNSASFGRKGLSLVQQWEMNAVRKEVMAEVVRSWLTMFTFADNAGER
jgi:hypothetical protein